MGQLALLSPFCKIFHRKPCTHGAFFPSPRWNRNIGYLFGILTFTAFTAFSDWRRTHAGHHIRVGDLDRRGIGDIWTLTVDVYRAAPLRQRLAYLLYRHPVIMFGLGPGYHFLLRNRWPSKGAKKRDIMSVVFTNLALVVIVVASSLTVGFKTYLLVQLPVLLIAATLGVWLFYVQHQHEGVYWACHEGIPALRAVKPLTLGAGFSCLRLKLYDERRGQMVGFQQAEK